MISIEILQQRLASKCHPVLLQMNISAKTLAVTASHFDGTLEYAVHNLYALYQARATADALRAIRQKRHFIFTRCALNRLRG